MDFSEWNSLPPHCVKLSLSVHTDWGGGGMSTQFNTSLKAALSASRVTATHSFINYFSLPSIGLKLGNTAQTLNSRHTKPNAVEFLYSLGLSEDQGTEEPALGS